jgi:hypothetical protein
VLDGGIEGRPDNVVLYATSNRRHLMPRDMIENERQAGINPSEAVEEKVSLSDRFGLWLGFHPCNQDAYLAMIRGYCDAYGIAIDDETLRAEAIEWQQTRGSRSGRVAWQFVTDLAGRRGVPLGGKRARAGFASCRMTAVLSSSLRTQMEEGRDVREATHRRADGVPGAAERRCGHRQGGDRQRRRPRGDRPLQPGDRLPRPCLPRGPDRHRSRHERGRPRQHRGADRPRPRQPPRRAGGGGPGPGERAVDDGVSRRS